MSLRCWEAIALHRERYKRVCCSLSDMPPSHETSDEPDTQPTVTGAVEVVQEVETESGAGVCDGAQVVSDIVEHLVDEEDIEEDTIALDLDVMNFLYSPCTRLSMCTDCTYFMYCPSALSVTIFKV